MAKANGMNTHYFFDYVKGSRKRKDPIPAETVITLSGQSPHSMRYAILELCSSQELAAMNVVGRPRPGFSIRGKECIRCASSRSIYEPVTCWKRSEDVICLPHRRWTTGIKPSRLRGYWPHQAGKPSRSTPRATARSSKKYAGRVVS